MKLQARIRSVTLAVAILPLLALALLLFLSFRTDVTQARLAHMQSIAAIQGARVHEWMEQNIERLRLIASRTKLRDCLAAFLETGQASDVATMERILLDAAGSISEIDSIHVYGPSGELAASTDRGKASPSHPHPELLARSLRVNSVDFVHRDEEGRPRVYLAGPLLRGDLTLGVLLVRVQMQRLFDAVGDSSGLGKTGETILLREVPGVGHEFLAPTRFRPDVALTMIEDLPEADGHGCDLQLGTSNADCIDYRGVPVFASSGIVPGSDWSVIVKIDRDEAFAGVRRAATQTFVAAGLMLLLILLLSGRLSRALTTPLRRLSSATQAVAAGDYSLRLGLQRDDELGELAKSFDQMTERVEDGQTTLRSKIEELDGEIERRRKAEGHNEELIAELRQALEDIKHLEGIIPICASCKKIRDDQGYWNQLEVYITEHSDARFSHGLCPDCLAEFEAELEGDGGDAGGGDSSSA